MFRYDPTAFSRPLSELTLAGGEIAKASLISNELASAVPGEVGGKESDYEDDIRNLSVHRLDDRDLCHKSGGRW
jgi:hypothetical protein